MEHFSEAESGAAEMWKDPGYSWRALGSRAMTCSSLDVRKLTRGGKVVEKAEQGEA